MESAERLDLAHAPTFRIGPIMVEPALRQVTAVRSETLEPRVMQVLVVLALANGAIVSRDDLVRQCWEGRIVGDDAINRVIARLRRLAEEHGDGAFRIETITKVGYRLVGPVALATPVRPAPLQAAPHAPASAPPPASLSRRQRRYGLAALLVLGLAGLGYAMRDRLPFATAAKPTILISTFDVAGSGVSPQTAATLRDEIVTAFIEPAKYAVVTDIGDASRAYHLSGRMVSMPGGLVRVFARLEAPGQAAPIWTPRLDSAAANPEALADLGKNLATGTACIAVAASATGPDRLTPALLPLQVDVCNEYVRDDGTPMSRIDKLRRLVAAGPQLIEARAELASIIGDIALNGSTTAAMRAEGLELAKFVTERAPGKPKGWTAMALLQPVWALAARERYFQRSISVEPSDCGCEFKIYSYFLSMVGRGREATQALNRSIDMMPGDLEAEGRLAETLGVQGDYGAADAILARLEQRDPQATWFHGLRWRNAMLAGDWRTARLAMAGEPQNPSRPLRVELINALESRNPARIRAAGAAYIALTRDARFLSRGTVLALALTGHDREAIADASRMIDQTPGFATVLFEPALARARQTPEFAALVTRLGLTDYWRTSGHLPDFCTAPGAPALCQTLRPASARPA